MQFCMYLGAGSQAPNLHCKQCAQVMIADQLMLHCTFCTYKSTLLVDNFVKKNSLLKVLHVSNALTNCADLIS